MTKSWGMGSPGFLSPPSAHYPPATERLPTDLGSPIWGQATNHVPHMCLCQGPTWCLTHTSYKEPPGWHRGWPVGDRAGPWEGFLEGEGDGEEELSP